MLRSRIAGTGSSVPSKILTNAELEGMVDTSDEWITSRTGIKERRIAGEDELPSTLSTRAALDALSMASITPEDLDLIIVATVTPDMVFPSTACFVQNNIKAVNAAAFDVSAACSGFLYALDIGDRYIRSGGMKNILVIGVDFFSRIINWQDRNTCVLFGDGAGAVVLVREDGDRGVLSTHIHSNGEAWETLYAPLNGTNGEGKVVMNGNETFKVAVRSMEDAAVEALSYNNVTGDDLTLFIPHQANARIIKATAQRLNLSMEKVFMNVDKYGNTSSASIPLALNEALRLGRIKEGDLLLMVTFGGGLTWASSLVRW
ncbi:MAG: beta-ketoacyl-ACP synthase III [Thermodesulfobacteriota bacterium]